MIFQGESYQGFSRGVTPRIFKGAISGIFQGVTSGTLQGSDSLFLLVLRWLPCQAPGHIGSQLGLVGQVILLSIHVLYFISSRRKPPVEKTALLA